MDTLNELFTFNDPENLLKNIRYFFNMIEHYD
jgi:hypothetical protein